MDSKQQILRFSQKGREHLNTGERIRAGMWALLVFGAVALLAELSFVLRGHRVAPPILLLPLTLSVSVAAGCYLRFRFSHRKAVGHIDRFFDLKEGLVTADEHIRENRADEIHKLQLRHTGRALLPHDPAGLRPPFPRRLLLVSAVLVGASVALLAVGDSAAVKEEKAEQAATLERSAELAEELGLALEEMLEQADPEMAELLEDPSLKSMIEEFEGGSERRAVMRKLSEIDRKLSKMQGELDTRADENYLMELADHLRQSRETAALGESLSKRDYKQAAKELENMQLGEQSGAEQRKALEKLAAQIGAAEKSMSKNESGSRRNAQEMSRQIQKMSQECKQNGQCSDQSRNAVNRSMKQSGNSMRQVAARKQAQSALDQLRKQLQQGQNGMNGKGKSTGRNGRGEGGKPGEGAGEGIDRSRRPPGAQSPAEGTMEHLSGQLGEGESEKVVEDAASGAGVASRGGGEKGAEGYRRQVEAFVRREDIPEEMKHGVKIYFEQIHALEEKAGEK